VVTRLRLTCGRAADGGVSSKRTDSPHRVELKTTCPKAGVVESLARPRSSLPLKIRPSAMIGVGFEIEERPRVSPRIALAHKEDVYNDYF